MRNRFLVAVGGFVALAACGSGGPTASDRPAADDVFFVTIGEAAEAAIAAVREAYIADTGRERPVGIIEESLVELPDGHLGDALLVAAALYEARTEAPWMLEFLAPLPNDPENRFMVLVRDEENPEHSLIYAVELRETPQGWAVGDVVVAGEAIA